MFKKTAHVTNASVVLIWNISLYVMIATACRSSTLMDATGSRGSSVMDATASRSSSVMDATASRGSSIMDAAASMNSHVMDATASRRSCKQTEDYGKIAQVCFLYTNACVCLRHARDVLQVAAPSLSLIQTHHGTHGRDSSYGNINCTTR